MLHRHRRFRLGRDLRDQYHGVRPVVFCLDLASKNERKSSDSHEAQWPSLLSRLHGSRLYGAGDRSVRSSLLE
jgi:hypothetical protein